MTPRQHIAAALQAAKLTQNKSDLAPDKPFAEQKKKHAKIIAALLALKGDF